MLPRDPIKHQWFIPKRPICCTDRWVRAQEVTHRFVGREHVVDRLAFRNADNKPVAVFAATTLGYGVAAQFLGRAVAQPGEDVTTVVLAGMVRVNELYLTLAHGRAATNGPFAWVASRATDLPSWEEINVGKGRAEKRRVTPAW